MNENELNAKIEEIQPLLHKIEELKTAYKGAAEDEQEGMKQEFEDTKKQLIAIQTEINTLVSSMEIETNAISFFKESYPEYVESLDKLNVLNNSKKNVDTMGVSSSNMNTTPSATKNNSTPSNNSTKNATPNNSTKNVAANNSTNNATKNVAAKNSTNNVTKNVSANNSTKKNKNTTNAPVNSNKAPMEGGKQSGPKRKRKSKTRKMKTRSSH
jgi:hypothetical protein